MHQPWLTYRRFIFLRQYCRYMFCYCSGSSMTCGCVVTWGDNRRWLMNMLWCIVNDLWMRRHIGFRMTYECVVMGVADLLIRHVLFIVNHSSLDLFTLCRGWLLNMLWCIVDDLWMRRHVGFPMTYERVVMCRCLINTSRVAFCVTYSSLDLLSLCLVDDLWTYHAIVSSDYEYVMGCFLRDLFVERIVYSTLIIAFYWCVFKNYWLFLLKDLL